MKTYTLSNPRKYLKYDFNYYLDNNMDWINANLSKDVLFTLKMDYIGNGDCDVLTCLLNSGISFNEAINTVYGSVTIFEHVLKENNKHAGWW